jgi:hypothetical protein
MHVPKCAQDRQESKLELGSTSGDGAGKLVMKCELCTEPLDTHNLLLCLELRINQPQMHQLWLLLILRVLIFLAHHTVTPLSCSPKFSI